MSLTKREAALRAEATKQLVGALMQLDSGAVRRNAWDSAIYNHPRAALLAIKRAEVRLGRAKAALRKWAKP